MIRFALGVLILPFAVGLLYAVLRTSIEDFMALRQSSPVVWWAVICFVSFFAVIFPIAAVNDWKRKKKRKAHVERTQAAGKPVTPAA